VNDLTLEKEHVQRNLGTIEGEKLRL